MIILYVLPAVCVSIGLLIASVSLRSISLATLNFCIWLLYTFAVQPWSNYSSTPPNDPELRLFWEATLIWMLFFVASVIVMIICAILRRPVKPPRRRKRRTHHSELPIPSES